MSNYNKYARELDKIVKAAFAEATKADAALTAAEDAKRQYPQRTGYGITPEYALKAAQAQADCLAAEKHRNEIREKLEYTYRKQIEQLRDELKNTVDIDFQVKPEQIDNNALELLKSGIMTTAEYNAMLNKAAADNNPTMARLIGKYADEAAETVAQKYGISDHKATELRHVAIQARQNHGQKWIDAFDYMVDVYNRGVKNPYMRGQWDELCAPTVEAF